MTAVLRNAKYPALRIVDPETGETVQFQSGVLVINEDDRLYDVVMKVAQRRAEISITTTGILTCECGETFSGKVAKLNLGKHQKATGHAGAKDASEKVKQGAEFVCPADNLAFKTEQMLVKHVQDAHTPRPRDEDEEPESTASGAVLSGTLTIPAARPRG